jgi:hypothetical protein
MMSFSMYSGQVDDTLHESFEASLNARVAESLLQNKIPQHMSISCYSYISCIEALPLYT